jgi:hypothetical protein
MYIQLLNTSPYFEESLFPPIPLISERWRFSVGEFEGKPDHLHYLVSNLLRIQLIELVSYNLHQYGRKDGCNTCSEQGAVLCHYNCRHF